MNHVKRIPRDREMYCARVDVMFVFCRVWRCRCIALAPRFSCFLYCRKRVSSPNVYRKCRINVARSSFHVDSTIIVMCDCKSRCECSSYPLKRISRLRNVLRMRRRAMFVPAGFRRCCIALVAPRFSRFLDCQISRTYAGSVELVSRDYRFLIRR